ncbi:conserved hypothetical protein [Vibrio crassostreae]|uniref:hypothetical protein n=1 Tax=Vibrio crassostreae TaxID=246167 RepID=UPI000F45FD07|nr:hypothetical protein [Vibrio crassostreae]ROS69326.1 hypothetical protein EDB73_102124 [Vibrio crassostreae]TCN82388.1 hypothetical protein EDB37_102222 [Vibrio crassostreae]CAK2461280.1 conserved hypothetical protein [Vibrio crassostreae]CAK2465820.1 conserved hypothetical protein [Vibrio crassostreae]CAK3934765.1 conserved hypothetical protein [Vibrio crassostreae]
MEDLIVAYFRVLSSFFRYLFQSLVIEFIGYGSGWIVCKVFTLGRFPSLTPTEKERTRISYIGAISIVLLLLAIGMLNSL